MSRLESASRVVLEFNESFNRADFAALQGLIAEDCVFESPSPAPGGTVFKGRQSILAYLEDFFQRFPQVQLAIEDIFGSGPRCVVRWVRYWVDVEGETRSLQGVDLYRVRDRSINEILSYTKGSFF
jgi:ketosteroid isomerase-like protein